MLPSYSVVRLATSYEALLSRYFRDLTAFIRPNQVFNYHLFSINPTDITSYRVEFSWSNVSC